MWFAQYSDLTQPWQPTAESGSIRVATIAVTWGAATADELAGAGPTAVVSNVAELAAQQLSDAR
jgi:hypothetical protein